MSQSLAAALHERLLDTFPATQAYAPADWSGDAMPGPVAHFLEQLLRHRSRREARRLRRARSDWVDYDHPEMETAVRTFFDAMEAHTRVPADAWADTLRQATHHTTAHLVRPVHVLTDFVYAERQTELRLPEILWRMGFFGPYGYLRQAVQAFGRKHDLDALGPNRFERFLHRVDERITDGYDAERWTQLLGPLFETARCATGREQVPTPVLTTFFGEKGRKDLEWALERYAQEGHEAITPRVLRRLLEQAAAGDGPDDPAPSDPAAGPSPVERDGREAPPEPDGTGGAGASAADDEIWGVAGAARPEGNEAPEPSADEREDVPLWKQFQQGRTDAAAGSERNDGKSGGDRRQEPLWARFRQGSDERLSEAVAGARNAGASGPAASSSGSSAGGQNDELERLERAVLGRVKPSHRGVYIQQLFGGDETNYRQVLRRLADADSWGEASQLIASDIFRAHKVNIYSDAAVHFTNAVEDRFRE
jgi:hypothetical protein